MQYSAAQCGVQVKGGLFTCAGQLLVLYLQRQRPRICGEWRTKVAGRSKLEAVCVPRKGFKPGGPITQRLPEE